VSKQAVSAVTLAFSRNHSEESHGWTRVVLANNGFAEDFGLYSLITDLHLGDSPFPSPLSYQCSSVSIRG